MNYTCSTSYWRMWPYKWDLEKSLEKICQQTLAHHKATASTILFTSYLAKSIQDCRIDLDQEHNCARPNDNKEDLPEHLHDHTYTTFQPDSSINIDQQYADDIGWATTNRDMPRSEENNTNKTEGKKSLSTMRKQKNTSSKGTEGKNGKMQIYRLTFRHGTWHHTQKRLSDRHLQ